MLIRYILEKERGCPNNHIIDGIDSCCVAFAEFVQYHLGVIYLFPPFAISSKYNSDAGQLCLSWKPSYKVIKFCPFCSKRILYKKTKTRLLTPKTVKVTKEVIEYDVEETEG